MFDQTQKKVPCNGILNIADRYRTTSVFSVKGSMQNHDLPTARNIEAIEKSLLNHETRNVFKKHLEKALPRTATSGRSGSRVVEWHHNKLNPDAYSKSLVKRE